jgi:hypothetical protein
MNCDLPFATYWRVFSTVIWRTAPRCERCILVWARSASARLQSCNTSLFLAGNWLRAVRARPAAVQTALQLTQFKTNLFRLIWIIVTNYD